VPLRVQIGNVIGIVRIDDMGSGLNGGPAHRPPELAGHKIDRGIHLPEQRLQTIRGSRV
jgi:hypothetical protein